MPTSTSRLGLPVPVSTDPANVPSDMLALADALDAEAVIFISTPGPIGSLPASPIKGTIYSVNTSPPYLLWYTGETTTPTPTCPGGYRLVGQAGTNVANISNANPGQSAQLGAQPVWAPLDHQHPSLPWGTTGQVSTSSPGDAANGGSAAAYARANHTHGREAGLQTATINAIHNGPPPTVDITLTIGSVSATSVLFLASYHPTVGDLVYVDAMGNGLTTADMIVIGPASTVPYPAVPTFHVHTSGAQGPTPFGTLWACEYDIVDIDTANGYNSGDGIYTIPQSGYWTFTAQMSWVPFAAGVRILQWDTLSNVLNGAVSCDASNVDEFGRANMTGAGQVTAGQQVRVLNFQTGGTGGLYLSPNGDNSFTGTRLHA